MSELSVCVYKKECSVLCQSVEPDVSKDVVDPRVGQYHSTMNLGTGICLHLCGASSYEARTECCEFCASLIGNPAELHFFSSQVSLAR